MFFFPLQTPWPVNRKKKKTVPIDENWNRVFFAKTQSAGRDISISVGALG